MKKQLSNLEVDMYGTKRWYNEVGELHRDNGLPAVEFFDGHKVWYDENGDCCRIDDWILSYEI